jgi:hypothetical protein
MKNIPLPASLAAILLAGLLSVQGQSSGGGKETILQPASQPVDDDEWHFTFTPYLWLPSVDLDLSLPDITVGNRTFGGDFSIDQPWWDTLSDFSSDFYVLSLNGRFEAWRGRWGGFIDGYWIFGKSTVTGSDSKMVLRDRVAIATSSSITSRFDTGQVNFGPQYLLGTAPLNETGKVAFVLYGGGRVNWIGNDLDGSVTVAASAAPGAVTSQYDFSTSDSRVFIEPMIGLKTIWTLGPRWFATLRGDVGGFGWVENNWDCDLEASINWEMSDGFFLDFGYRARGQWEDGGSGGDFSTEGWFFGPELGVTWRF